MTRLMRGIAALALAAGLVLAGGRAEAQFGVGGFYGGGVGGFNTGFGSVGYGGGVGFSPYGYGYGGWPWYGGVTGYGVSLPQLAAFRSQQYALNSSRYNMLNAETATGYEAANLMKQQAVNTLLQNYMLAGAAAGGRGYGGGGNYAGGGGSPGRANYSINRGDGNAPAANAAAPPRGGNANAGGDPVEQPARFDQIIAPDGEVFWPLGAPSKGELGQERDEANKAIADVMRDSRDNGRVSVKRLIQARRKLGQYATDAAREMRDNDEVKDKDVRDFAHFVNTLDTGLRALAAPPGGPGGAAAGRREDTTPPTAPKTAGEVLKKEANTDRPR